MNIGLYVYFALCTYFFPQNRIMYYCWERIRHRALVLFCHLAYDVLIRCIIFCWVFFCDNKLLNYYWTILLVDTSFQSLDDGKYSQPINTNKLVFLYLLLTPIIIRRVTVLFIQYKNRIQLVPSQQTQNICITFIQRRPNVFDVGPTLYKCYTHVLCLLGYMCV